MCNAFHYLKALHVHRLKKMKIMSTMEYYFSGITCENVCGRNHHIYNENTRGINEKMSMDYVMRKIWDTDLLEQDQALLKKYQLS